MHWFRPRNQRPHCHCMTRTYRWRSQSQIVSKFHHCDADELTLSGTTLNAHFPFHSDVFEKSRVCCEINYNDQQRNLLHIFVQQNFIYVLRLHFAFGISWFWSYRSSLKKSLEDTKSFFLVWQVLDCLFCFQTELSWI